MDDMRELLWYQALYQAMDQVRSNGEKNRMFEQVWNRMTQQQELIQVRSLVRTQVKDLEHD